MFLELITFFTEKEIKCDLGWPIIIQDFLQADLSLKSSEFELIMCLNLSWSIPLREIRRNFADFARFCMIRAMIAN